MLPGTYEARSLESAVTATVPLYGNARGRLMRERIVEFVSSYWTEHGYGPSVRDIARGVGLHRPSGAEYQIQILLADGRLQRTAGVARSLRVVER